MLDGGIGVSIRAIGSGVKVTYELANREAFAEGLIETLVMPEGWTAVQDGAEIVLLDPTGVEGGRWSGGPTWDSSAVVPAVEPLGDPAEGQEPVTDEPAAEEPAAEEPAAEEPAAEEPAAEETGSAAVAVVPGPAASVELLGVVDGVATARVVVDEVWLADEARRYPIFIDPTISFTYSPPGSVPGMLWQSRATVSPRKGGPGTYGPAGTAWVQMYNPGPTAWPNTVRGWYAVLDMNGNMVQGPLWATDFLPTLQPGQFHEVAAPFSVGDLPYGDYLVHFELNDLATAQAVGTTSVRMMFRLRPEDYRTTPGPTAVFKTNGGMKLSVNPGSHSYSQYEFSIQPATLANASALSCTSAPTNASSSTPVYYPPQFTAGVYMWCVHGWETVLAGGVTYQTGSSWHTRLLEYRILSELKPRGLRDVEDAVVQGVDVQAGNWRVARTDLTLATAGAPLALSRVYNSLDQSSGMFGVGWSTPWEMRLDGTDGSYEDSLILYDGDGGVDKFVPSTTYSSFSSITSWKGPGGVTTTIVREGTGFRLLYLDGSSQLFNATGDLTQIRDAKGVVQSLVRDGAGRVTQVKDDLSGRSITFGYAFNGVQLEVVTTATVANPAAPTGSVTWTYTYLDPLSVNPRLGHACNSAAVAPATLHCEQHAWSVGQTPLQRHRMSTVRNAIGELATEVFYDAEDKVSQIAQYTNSNTDTATIGFTAFAYNSTPGVTRVTDIATGSFWLYEFNAQSQFIKKTAPAGQVTSYAYNTDGMLERITDGNGNAASFVYDTNRRLTRRTNGDNESTWYFYNQALPRPTSDVTAECNHYSAGVISANHCVQSVYDSSNRLTERRYQITPTVQAIDRWEYAGVGGQVSKHTSPVGDVTLYGYSAAGDLNSLTQPGGGVTSYTHNRWGAVQTVTQAGVAIGTNTFDSAGRVTRTDGPAITNPITSVVHRGRFEGVYAPTGVVASTTETDLATGVLRNTLYSYDRQLREIQSTSPDGGVIRRDFDLRGNVVRVCDARGKCVRSDYNTSNQLTATWAVNYNGGADRRLRAYTYDLGGRVLTEIDENGTVFRYGYDGADRRTSTTLLAINDTTRNVRIAQMVYDDRGLPTTVTEGGTETLTPLRTTTTVYNVGGLTERVTINRTGGNHLTEMTYTAAGQIKSTTVRLEGTTDSSTVEYTYLNGELATETRILSPGNPENPRTTYGYDAFGRLTSTTDPSGNVWTYVVNTAGLTTKVTGPPVEVNGVAPAVAASPTDIGYDAYGNVISRRDPLGHVTSYEYDKLDRQTKIIHPTYTPILPAGSAAIPAIETFHYDLNGNLEIQTTRRGYQIRHIYDDLNRVTSTSNERGLIRLFEYDLAGNLTKLTTEMDAVTTYAYNDFNLVKTKTEVVRGFTLPSGNLVAAGNYQTTYTYTDLGALESVTTPLGLRTAYTYDALNNQLTVTDPDNKVTSYTYNHLGQVKDVKDPMNRISRTTYNALGQVTQTVRVGIDATLSRQVTYTYDRNGNQKTMTDTEGGLTTFGYDSHNRLVSATVRLSVSPIVDATTSYGYSRTGQLTYVRNAEGHVVTNTYNVWDLVETTVEPLTLQHPAAADRTFTSVYDADGQLVKSFEPAALSSRRRAMR